jgi:hypothetical protein
MKIFLMVSLLAIIISHANAQDTTKKWTRGGLASLNLNQVGFSNWAAGGDNSFSSTALFNIFLNYKYEKISWENSIDLGYGFVKVTSNPLRKNEDKIIVNSKYGRQVFSQWYLTALLNFRSQFAPGYNFPNDSVAISRFIAPAFIVTSLGLDYKPKDYFSLYLSSATGKFTVVNDPLLSNAGAYGVDTGKVLRAEFGWYLSAKFEKSIMNNVDMKSRLDLFSNYTDPNKENRGNIDVNWETAINMKVNKYIAVTIFTHLIYDHDILVPRYLQRQMELDHRPA